MLEDRKYRSTSGFRNLLGEELEFLVEHLTSLPLLLLELKLILVTIPVLALPVSGLIELHVGGLAVELNVLWRSIRAATDSCSSITHMRLLLPNHDRSL